MTRMAERIAALYDIHGNLPALEAVLDDVKRADVDLIVIGGDVVPGPMPRETIDRLRDLDIPTRFIHGNGDRAIRTLMAGGAPADIPAPYREIMTWTASQLDATDDALLGSWPPTLRLRLDEIGDVLFCHATP